MAHGSVTIGSTWAAYRGGPLSGNVDGKIRVARRRAEARGRGTRERHVDLRLSPRSSLPAKAQERRFGHSEDQTRTSSREDVREHQVQATAWVVKAPASQDGQGSRGSTGLNSVSCGALGPLPPPRSAGANLPTGVIA
ncbi:unnamed protein product [Clonostachys byssicola]|uniref:Uncharacterized protein n=1 Tax=Clonostachys byssicola TaxID=160290 RepID=A0A9N9XWH6_9HYPO|nr:unnamed protein product [Clonostachys byssicola]